MKKFDQKIEVFESKETPIGLFGIPWKTTPGSSFSETGLDDIETRIKKLGKEGWEWVGYDNSTSGTYIIFKKEIL